MPSRKLKDAHPKLQVAYNFSKKLFEYNNPTLEVILTCTYRSPEEQTLLYDQPFDGLDNDRDDQIDEGDEKVTNAKAGQSKHNVYPSLAIDIAFKNKETKITDWSLIHFKNFYGYMKAVDEDIRWGGLFKSVDGPHYEI